MDPRDDPVDNPLFDSEGISAIDECDPETTLERPELGTLLEVVFELRLEPVVEL